MRETRVQILDFGSVALCRRDGRRFRQGVTAVIPTFFARSDWRVSNVQNSVMPISLAAATCNKSSVRHPTVDV